MSKRKHASLPCDAEEISADDYYAKSSEFRLWLDAERDKQFSALSRDDATKYFAKFVRRWNDGALKDMYYVGVSPTDLLSKLNKKSAWKHSSKLSAAEQQSMDSVASAAHTSSSSKRSKASSHQHQERHRESESDRRARKETEREERDYESKRRERHRKEQHRSLMDEIAPKETGRDALIAKRREKAAKIHGRAREVSPGISDHDLYGGGKDDSSRQLSRLKEKAREKESARSEHARTVLARHNEKEALRMAEMRALLDARLAREDSAK